MGKQMTASQEEYLKTIYILLQNRKQARVTDIANYLGYSKASVNKGLKMLKTLELIHYETYGEISFTPEGEEKAKSILKRHNVLKAFLMQVLNVEEQVAEQEAKLMKHAVSEKTIQKFETYIKSIIEVNELDCNYNAECQKCQNCIRLKTKNRFDKEK